MAGSHAPVLGLDVDGTIWSCYERAFEYIERLTGDHLSHEDMTSYDYLFERYSPEVAIEAFAFATDPAYCFRRILYRGCHPALRSLARHGVDIRFITHTYDPDLMREPVTEWLRLLFGNAEVDVLHHTESKADRLLEVGAFGIVDDKPETLLEVADEGLLAMTLIQPWNKETVASRDGIVGFESWRYFLVTFSEALAARGHALIGGRARG